MLYVICKTSVLIISVEKFKFSMSYVVDSIIYHTFLEQIGLPITNFIPSVSDKMADLRTSEFIIVLR